MKVSHARTRLDTTDFPYIIANEITYDETKRRRSEIMIT